MIRRCLTLTAVRGHPEAIGRAIASLADGTSGLEHVPTVDIPLDEVGDMLTRLAAAPDRPHRTSSSGPTPRTPDHREGEKHMLTPEQNERLVRTDRGTEMGTLLRRYWIPALLAEEIPSPTARRSG
ncbi:hypothetical protein ACFQV4_23225 [Streptomyces thermocarboxydus]